MDASKIRTLAEACYSRGALAGFQEGDIRVDGDRFTLSPVEAATIERAISRVKDEESILIETSFPANSVPVGLAVASAYSEHPNMGGKNSPVLLFPKQGYTTVFDRFHYRDTANWSSQPGSQPIPRQPAGSLSEVEDSWGVFTANSRFHFDIAECPTLPTAIIVDLRAPRWNDTYARQLVDLFAAAHRGRFVFIGDSDGYGMGHKLARTHAHEHIQIGPKHLEASPIESVPIELDTALSTVENTLATQDVAYDYYSIIDSEAHDMHRRFAAKKIELQERDIATTAVGGLYNRLTQLPIKSKYWNRVSDAHGFFDSIPQQIDYLTLISDRTSRGSSRIQNFIETARHLEAILNEEHQLQNYLLNAVEGAQDLDDETRFVFSNERVKEAFVLAAEENSVSLGVGNVTLTTRSEVTPTQDARTVYAGTVPRESTHYEFPMSETVVFVHFAIVGAYVSSRGRSLAGNSVKHTEHTVGEGSGNLEPLDLDDIEADVEQVVGPVNSEKTEVASGGGLMGETSLWETDTTQPEKADTEEGSEVSEPTNPSTNKRSKVQLQINFEETHEPIRLSPLSRVTKYYPNEGDIDRARAKGLESGDTILLMDDIADDIYDIVIDESSELESVREDIDLIEGWRDNLNQTVDEDDRTVKEFQEQLAKMGSDITSPATVSLWRYGTTIAPGDEEDIKRVYQLCQPGIDASMFNTLASEVNRAADRLRDRHQKIGNRIRSLIEHELDATTSSSEPEYYDEKTRRRIREDTKRLTVAEIETQAIEPAGQDSSSPSSKPESN